MSDPLAPSRGIVIGLFLAAIFWLLLAALIIHHSVMAELGRKAVEQGVIR